MLDLLKRLNPHVRFHSVDSEAFKAYGRIVEEYNFEGLIKYMEGKTSIPEAGNTYVASVKEMEATPIHSQIKEDFYGSMPIQIGYCNGRNSTLNGLEYHKGSEINVAVTDMVLLLGKIQDIRDNKYDADNAEAFFIPEGTAVELYGTTLHFSPCRTSNKGFKCIVILPAGTNLPLENKAPGKGEAKLLFMKNKWLLAHPERKPLIEKGAYPGIIGENLEVHFE